jgi:hypothetical protein
MGAKTLFLSALLAGAIGAGCTSVGGSAVRTDGGWAQKNMGAVRIYAVIPPNAVRVIGFVEVHAVNEEANFETLMPAFTRRVAEIGGSGGIVDHVQTGYEMRTEYRTESYQVPCGYKSTCWTTRVVPYTYQVRILSIQGRALLPIDSAGPPAIDESGPRPAIPAEKVLPPPLATPPSTAAPPIQGGQPL